MKPLSEAEKLDMFAMQIVHLVGRIQHEKVPDDATSKAFVDIRQASNDEAIEAVKDLIRSVFDELESELDDGKNSHSMKVISSAIQKIRSRYE